MALLATSPAARAADSDSPTGPVGERFSEWVARMDSYYTRHPELKEQRGSGWKPYNRLKWFYGHRVFQDAGNAVQARWNAYLRKTDLEERNRAQAMSSWFSLGPTNLAGRMLDLEFDPSNTNIIYAGAADGGLWKSTNGGVSWSTTTDELPTLGVGAVAVIPSSPNVVLIGTGEATPFTEFYVGGMGVFKSTDAGASWFQTSLSYPVTSDHAFHMMEANPYTDVVLAAAKDGVWRTTDQGNTWAQVRSGGEFTDVKWKPGSADVVYAVRIFTSASLGRVFKSTDGGVTWSGASNGLPTGTDWGKTRMSVTPANPDYIYLGITNTVTGGILGIYRTTDGGANWSLRDNTLNFYGNQGWYNNVIQADPNDAEKVIVGGVQLYRSGDGGGLWSQLFDIGWVDHHGAVYRPGNNDNLFIANDGGIWESTNDGTNWSARNTNLVTYQFYDICVSQADQLRSWGGTQDRGTDSWFNSPTWLEGLGGDGMVCNAHPTLTSTVYGETQNGVHYKSINSGANWSWINEGITGAGLWVTPVDLDPSNGDRLFTASSDGLFRSLDGGSSWTNVSTDAGVVWLSISPVDPPLVWALASTEARFTTDGGASWNTAAPFGFQVGVGTKILAHPTDPSTAFVTFSTSSPTRARVARTTDLGVSWQDVTGDLPAIPVNAIAVDPQNVRRWFVGTDVGVWATATEGEAWVPFEVGLPNAIVMDLEIHDSGRKLRAGTYGRGMWEVDIASPSTGVGGTPPAAAQGIMLDPAYPNPLRDRTLLRYAARDAGPVQVIVYDVQGRVVARLAEHAADGLVRLVTWDATRVPAGAYLVLVRAGGAEKSQKLLVIR
jgi:uncharacterized cupin superfamily protein